MCSFYFSLLDFQRVISTPLYVPVDCIFQLLFFVAHVKYSGVGYSGFVLSFLDLSVYLSGMNGSMSNTTMPSCSNTLVQTHLVGSSPNVSTSLILIGVFMLTLPLVVVPFAARCRACRLLHQTDDHFACVGTGAYSLLPLAYLVFHCKFLRALARLHKYESSALRLEIALRVVIGPVQ